MWHHNEQSSSLRRRTLNWLWEIAVPPSGKSRLLSQLIAFIFCSLYKMSKLFVFPIVCLGYIRASLCFPRPVEPQAKLKETGSWSLSWALGEVSSRCLPHPWLLTNQLRSNWNFPLFFFFFLTTSKVLSPCFSETYPFLNFTRNHSGGKGIAEVRKYGKNVNNLPLKYTLRIFSASIISTLNF